MQYRSIHVVSRRDKFVENCCDFRDLPKTIIHDSNAAKDTNERDVNYSEENTEEQREKMCDEEEKCRKGLNFQKLPFSVGRWRFFRFFQQRVNLNSKNISLQK